MRCKSNIQIAEALVDEIVWPRNHPLFDQFKYALEQVIEENLPGHESKIHYSEDDGLFYSNLKITRTPIGGPTITVKKCLPIDPTIPLKPQICRLMKVHAALHNMALEIVRQINAATSSSSLGTDITITERAREINKEIDLFNLAFETAREERDHVQQ